MNRLIYILLLLLLCVSCEEIYTPKINTVAGQLIVDALVTNDLSQSYVHLTKTAGFYDKEAPGAITGATVKLIDSKGIVQLGIEGTPGNFSFKKAPTTGETYHLQIQTGNELYESESVLMPDLPTVSKFYTERTNKIEYTTNSSGTPVGTSVLVQSLYLDAPVSAALSNYRFNTRTVMEWIYIPPNTPMPPTIFGWQSLYNNNTYNIAGPKKFSQSEQIEKQLLMELPYNTTGLIQTGASVVGWILILDQFGTSQGSFDYHEKLNSQFTAAGSLFDPIQTQIYGNITCKTDASKAVFGYFDLNSYRQRRYYVYFPDPKSDNPVITREITSYTDIPDNGKSTNLRPVWWE
jgi:hypothetical protein